MSKVEVNSIRKYEVYTVQNGISEKYNVTLNDLLFNESDASETIYALRDIIDEVMDIPENCTTSFNPVRDNTLGAYGLITRIR